MRNFLIGCILLTCGAGCAITGQLSYAVPIGGQKLNLAIDFKK